MNGSNCPIRTEIQKYLQIYVTFYFREEANRLGLNVSDFALDSEISGMVIDFLIQTSGPLSHQLHLRHQEPESSKLSVENSLPFLSILAKLLQWSNSDNGPFKRLDDIARDLLGRCFKVTATLLGGDQLNFSDKQRLAECLR